MQQSESRNYLPQILRAPQVLEATGLGRSTLWRLVKSGSFPRPVQLGPQARGRFVVGRARNRLPGVPQVVEGPVQKSGLAVLVHVVDHYNGTFKSSAWHRLISSPPLMS